MQTDRLFDGIPVKGQIPAGEIGEIYSDSRRVRAGSLFVCLRGGRFDGHGFAADAIRQGAVAVLAERMPEGVDPGRVILTDDTRRAESLLWHNLTGRAADGMHKIAVTGTAGKTSVAFLTAAILRASGHRVGLITTVRAEADGCEIGLGDNGGSSVCDIPGAMTTPDPEYFFGAVRRMRDMGCDTLVYEASSQSLILKKTSAIIPDAAVFTNLTPEHLDAHGTMEAYFEAKASLLSGVKRAVVNLDDGWMAKLPARFPEARILGCTAEGDPMAEITATQIEERGTDGIAYLWQSPCAAFRVRCPLVGRYSVMNTMEAAAVSSFFGADPDEMKGALADFRGIPGRLERVPVPDPDAPAVFVDYAHTPDALAQVTETLAAMGPLTVVFGCGGERDRSKRPKMAEAAQRYARYVVVTEDNVRGEDPDAIFGDILAGMDPEKPYALIPDRREAIRHALGVTGKGGIVLLAGKGHEKYEIRADGRHPFDEAAVVTDYFRERGEF
ncbi:MAG: UDP-N-acetylmuramoyl-L-alanyl-D-glutamate--2,6-diaminopimelate ligase [Clostridiales bacterium]|nr:UDP-N-acetylmuramoyl-L-alanyl-D-glutamate--2,6-diaminopimelate ligase [Clostridiales bacterium]